MEPPRDQTTGNELRPSVAHQLAVSWNPGTDAVGTMASKLRRYAVRSISQRPSTLRKESS